MELRDFIGPLFSYPYCQKARIKTKWQRCLMKESFFTIRVHSPLVLLVKDKTLWFCINYRALNAITISDHFQYHQSTNYWMNWLVILISPSLIFVSNAIKFGYIHEIFQKLLFVCMMTILSSLSCPSIWRMHCLLFKIAWIKSSTPTFTMLSLCFLTIF